MRRKKLRLLFIAVLAAAGLFFLYKVKKIISPFIVGAVLAYLLSPAVIWLEKQGLGRKTAVAVIFAGILFFLGMILFLLLPSFYLELGKLVKVLPERIQVVYYYGQRIKFVISNAGFPGEVIRLIDEQLQKGQSYLISWLEEVIRNLPGLLVSVGLMVLSPIVAIYFLLDWNIIEEGIIKIVPQKMRGEWHRLLQEIDHVITKYIQGNLIDAVIVGILIGAGVKMFGMEYALIVGVICGITNLIPYFGPVLGAVPSVLLALGKSPEMAFKVALVIFIVQQIDSNIINPRLLSNKVGLHPLWIIFALLAGGELGGLLGMLVAIPLTAVFRIILREIYLYLVAPKALEESKK